LLLAGDALIQILDTFDFHVAAYDREWRHTYVNKAAAQALRRSPDEVLGRSIEDLGPDAFAHCYLEQAQEVALTGQPRRIEHHHAALGRWFEHSIHRVGDAVVVLSRDITDQRRAADELQEQQDVLHLAQLSGHVATFEWDFVALTARCSTEFFRLFGMPDRDDVLTAQEWGRYVHPEDQTRMAQHLAAALAGREEPSTDYRIIRGDGEVRWLTYAARIVERGGRARMYGVVHDITDRKRLERELSEQAVALKAADRLKDEFLAMLSHELRTPLNVVRGRTRMLVDGLTGDAQRRAIEVIDRNSATLERLVNDLLDVARMTRGQITLDRKPNAVGALLQEPLDAARTHAEAGGIALTVDVEEGLPTIAVDAMRLQQVLWNLLSNAVKFTPAGGTVAVRVRAIEGRVVVTVMDSGAGIPPEALPRVFDRFWQAAEPAERPDGLGLGLSIAKHLIELHGGTITAHSEGRGRGASFVLAIPIT
jgi:PAS domain S-box-containing protein